MLFASRSASDALQSARHCRLSSLRSKQTRARKPARKDYLQPPAIGIAIMECTNGSANPPHTHTHQDDASAVLSCI